MIILTLYFQVIPKDIKTQFTNNKGKRIHNRMNSLFQLNGIEVMV